MKNKDEILKEKKHMKNSLREKMLFVAIVPMIILAIVLGIVSVSAFYETMKNNVKLEMERNSKMILQTYNRMYEGDYSIWEDENGVLRLFKGEEEITADYTIIDELSEIYEVDVSFFFQDYRVLTTIKNEKGNRFIDSKAPQKIVTEILNGKQSKFYEGVIIGEDKNFAYYEPIINSNGKCFGMIGICRNSKSVYKDVSLTVVPIIVLFIIAIVLMGVVIVTYSQKLIKDIQGIERFMKNVSSGKFSNEMPYKIVQRTDELGELASSGRKMQQSIRQLVEFDALTELHNRRYGNTRLKEIKEKSIVNGTDFCVAIGDIDYFKKVNDTYGHDAGDEVLKGVAAILKKTMVGKGFVARWGGEEFLLVFDNCLVEKAACIVDDMFNEIRAMNIEYGEKVIKVTMSMGIIQADNSKDDDTLLKEADDNLYYAKTNGRNQLKI